MPERNPGDGGVHSEDGDDQSLTGEDQATPGAHEDIRGLLHGNYGGQRGRIIRVCDMPRHQIVPTPAVPRIDVAHRSNGSAAEAQYSSFTSRIFSVQAGRLVECADCHRDEPEQLFGAPLSIEQSAKRSIEFHQRGDFAFLYIPRSCDEWELLEAMGEFAQLPGIKICLMSGRQIPWDALTQKFPERTILLDGAGEGPTRAEGTHAYIDNHAADDTQCTCAKVFEMGRNGGLAQFRSNGAFDCTLCVNHLDADNIPALYLFLRQHGTVGTPTNALQTLVEIESGMDMHAGACDLSEDAAEQFKWLFYANSSARRGYGWHLDTLSGTGICQMLETCFKRLDAYADGKGERMPLDTRFDVLRMAPGWCVVQEIGTEARIGLAQAAQQMNIAAFASHLGMTPNGRHRYTFVNVGDGLFDLDTLCAVLNGVEDRPNVWGRGPHVAANHHAGTGMSVDPLICAVETYRGTPQSPFRGNVVNGRVVLPGATPVAR